MSKVFSALALGAVAVAGEAVRESVVGEYIVVLNKDVSSADRAMHMDKVSQSFAAKNMRVMNEYTIGNFQAYAVAGINDADVAAITNDANVQYVQPNYVDHISQACETQSGARPWGIRRTNLDGKVNTLSNPIPADYTYDPNMCGADVEVYVLDTGINETHEDFAGRAEWIADYTADNELRDRNGHGTHVASSAAGSLYGMAKCSPIKALKVCNAGGSCPSTAQLGAIARVEADAKAGKKIVANMSLGGLGTNTATLNAIEEAHKAGAMFVVASGNSNDNSCRYSPAQSPFAMTVDSSDSSDNRSSFSNYGACSDIFAPGSSILAAWIRSDTDTNTISGTSMASPHACGAAAMVWSANPTLGPMEVQELMIEQHSQKDVISNAGTSSHGNSLLMKC